MSRFRTIIALLLLVLLFGGAATCIEAAQPIGGVSRGASFTLPLGDDVNIVAPLPPMPPTPPKPGDQATDRSPKVIPPGSPGVVSMLYRFFDQEGNDWQSLHPEWGPIGAIHWSMWETVHPSEGSYNWSAVDRRLNDERGLRVTLPDGTEIQKPVVIQVFPFISSAYDWHGAYFYDGTPEWVYNKIDRERPDDPRPIINGRKVGYLLQGCPMRSGGLSGNHFASWGPPNGCWGHFNSA